MEGQVIDLTNNMSRIRTNLILECVHWRTLRQVLDVTFSYPSFELPFTQHQSDCTRLLYPGFFCVPLQNWSKNFNKYNV